MINFKEKALGLAPMFQNSNPGPNVTVTSLITQDQVPQFDGHQVGSSTAALIGFWGATPVAQQAGYYAVTDSSGGTANYTTGVAAFTAGYNETTTANAVATLAAAINGIQAALKTVGIIAGN